MSYPITTSLKVVKQVQYVKETIKGITPTSSPVFSAVPAKEFVPAEVTENTKYTKLGTADLLKSIKGPNLYDFSLSYTPIDGTLLPAMVNLVQNPSSSIDRDDSFTFLMSQQHNLSGTLTEMYQIARGCCIDSVTITCNTGEFVTVDSHWLAFSISDWSTSHGLTTPTFASEPTGVPWSAALTDPNPLFIEGISSLYDIINFSTTISHNTDRVVALLAAGGEGTTTTAWIQPTTRDITLELDIVWKDTTLSSDVVRTLTPKNMVMRLAGGGGGGTTSTLTYADVFLESYSETIAADSTEAKVISYRGFAGSVTVEVIPTVTRTSIQKYNISSYVANSSIHKYDILNVTPVTQTSIHKYNIDAEVVESSTHLYDIIANVAETSVHVYDITETFTVTQTSIQKYDIGAFTEEAASVHKYNIPANVISSSIQKYNIEETTGATRFYFHAATSSISGLPTAEQAIALVADWNLEGSQTTNRTMDPTIGTAQAEITDDGGTSDFGANIYVTRFVSPSLNVLSIDANTWTYSFATKCSSTSGNFPVSGSDKPVRVNLYVWRPSTSTKIGTVLDGNTASTVDEASANVERASTTTFSGSEVSGMQTDDVLIFEVWFTGVTRSSSIDMWFYFDGDTVTTTDGTVSNHASFLETPQSIAGTIGNFISENFTTDNFLV